METDNRAKHAYLILAHHNFEQLAMLLETLDFPDNDIFIHIDKKSAFDPAMLTSAVKYSRVFFTDRVVVNWGGYSVVDATLLVLEAAVNHGPYVRYHLLTGIDLPLRSQAFIHEYFDRAPDLEFISSAYPMASDRREFWNRVRYYFPFQECFSRTNLLGKVLRRSLMIAQWILRIDRTRNTDRLFGVGSAYFSITDRFARHVLTQKEAIHRHFSCGLCVDEMFLQWVYLHWDNPNPLYASNRKDHPYIQECYFDVCRAIDWTRGTPYTYTDEDFEMLMESGCLFARKFDYKTSPELVKRIMEIAKG